MADIGSTINAYLVYPFNKRDEYLNDKTKPDSGGPSLRRQRRSTAWQVFSLTVVFFNTTTRDAFLSFFNTHKGGLTSFTWSSPPSEVSSSGFTDCVLESDVADMAVSGPSVYKYTFTLVAYT